MSGLSELLAVFPSKFVAAAAVGGAFFLVYFSLDIFLFLTKRNFGRVNIELVYFTRNDQPRRSDALHFRTIESPIFLRHTYDNRFLFWRVIFRSMKATLANPVVNFGAFAYVALVPFRDRVAAKCSVGEIKRALGFPFREKRHQIVMVYERSPEKRRYVLKVLVIKEDDLRNVEYYLENPPKTEGKFELFKEVARVFKENPGTFLPVQIIAA